MARADRHSGPSSGTVPVSVAIESDRRRRSRLRATVAPVSLPQIAEALLRQKWIVVAIAMAAFAAAALVTFSVPTVYESTATLAVGGNRPTAPGGNQVEADATLARTYAELLKSASARDEAVRALPFKASPGFVADKVSFEAVGGTALLKITATDPDPRRAQTIANTYASSFVRVQQSSARDAAREALRDSSRRLRDLALRVDRLTQRNDASAVADLEQARTELEAERDAYRASRQNVALQSSNVSVASPAPLPESPARPRPKLYLLVGAMFAVVLGVFGGLLRDSFDTGIQDESELVELLGAPVLARLPRAGRRLESRDALGDSFQLLRTNIELHDPTRRIRTIAVTSAARGEGTTLVVAYLSSALALVGARVTAVDCDLRRPALHTRLEVDGTRGLSEVLVRPAVRASAEADARRVSAASNRRSREVALAADASWRPALLRDTTIPDLRVLPAGPRPANAAVLLTRDRFSHVLAGLRQSADYVVCDSPPVTMGADSAAVCASVDGVIVVVDTRSARRRAILALREQLGASGTRIMGVVLNP
jgi:Mrp family chromosome partitioning ATPase